jgi:hypothetical protein
MSMAFASYHGFEFDPDDGCEALRVDKLQRISENPAARI